MMKFKYHLLILASVSLWMACKENSEKQTTLKQSVGPINQIVTVLPEELKPVGLYLQTEIIPPLEASFYGEPSFTLIPFSNIEEAKNYTHYRNILILKLGDQSFLQVNDQYARNQTMFIASAPSLEKLKALLEKHKEVFMKQYHENDRKYWLEEQKFYKKNSELEKMGISFDIPMTYIKAKIADNYVHYKQDKTDRTRSRSANFWLTEKAYDLDTILQEDIIGLRDLMGRKYINSTKQGSYMTTDKVLREQVKTTLLKATEDLSLYQTTGQWSMENDIMGGDFINYVIIDKKRHKLFMFDGFVFASISGNYNQTNTYFKRDVITELMLIFSTHSMIKTLKP